MVDQMYSQDEMRRWLAAYAVGSSDLSEAVLAEFDRLREVERVAISVALRPHTALERGHIDQLRKLTGSAQ